MELTFIENGLNLLSCHTELTYMLTVCILTYLLITLLPFKSKKSRVITTFAVGVIIMVMYMVFVPECKLNMLILGLFATTGFYKYIMKPILKLFGVEYPHEFEDTDNDKKCDCVECTCKK